MDLLHSKQAHYKRRFLGSTMHRNIQFVQYSCIFPKILLPIKEIGLLLHIENIHVYNIINLITTNDYV